MILNWIPSNNTNFELNSSKYPIFEICHEKKHIKIVPIVSRLIQATIADHNIWTMDHLIPCAPNFEHWTWQTIHFYFKGTLYIISSEQKNNRNGKCRKQKYYSFYSINSETENICNKKKKNNKKSDKVKKSIQTNE